MAGIVVVIFTPEGEELIRYPAESSSFREISDEGYVLGGFMNPVIIKDI